MAYVRTYTRGSSSTPYTKESVDKQRSDQLSKSISSVSSPAPSTNSKTTVTYNKDRSSNDYGQSYNNLSTGYNPLAVISDLNKTATDRGLSNASVEPTVYSNYLKDNNISTSSTGNKNNNIPFDYDAFAEYLNSKGYLNKAPNSSYNLPEYNNLYSPEDLKNLFGNIQNQNYNYDPANDTLLKLSQDQAMSQTAQNMAKRGMLYSDSSKSKMFQAGMNLTPQFEQRAYDRYKGNLGDLYNQLTTMQGLEGFNYNRYRDLNQDQLGAEQENRNRYFEDVGLQNEMYNQARTQSYEDQDRMEQKELAQYGVVLSPKMREQVQAYQNISQADLRRLLPLANQEGGYATTINQLLKTDPNNPDLPLLNSLRAMKILSDPTLLNKYGQEYGMDSMGIKSMADQNTQLQQMQQLEREQAILEQINQLITNEKEANEVQKVLYQIEELKSNIQYKDEQTVKMMIETEMKAIERANLPEELRLKLQDLAASTSQKYAAINNYGSMINQRDLQNEIDIVKTNAEYGVDENGNYYKKNSGTTDSTTDPTDPNYDFKKDPRFNKELDAFYSDPERYITEFEKNSDVIKDEFNGRAYNYMLDIINKYKKDQSGGDDNILNNNILNKYGITLD